jgi:hypothetical protein
MSQSSTLTLEQPQLKVKPSKKAPHNRLFYSGAAALILVMMFWGFMQYYLHGKAFGGREIAPPMRTLVMFHGIAMTAWVVLFLVQPLLIAGGSRKRHMMLGRVGAILAIAMVVLGWRMGIQSARLTPPVVRIWGVTPSQFMIVPLGTIVLFGLFVAAGVYYRRRPEIHRPMMLMATLLVIPAAVSRIAPLSTLYENTALRAVFGPYLWTLVFATVLLLAKWAMTRSFDRWFAMAYGCLLAAYMLTWHLATTRAWERVAGMLL